MKGWNEIGWSVEWVVDELDGGLSLMSIKPDEYFYLVSTLYRKHDEAVRALID